MTYKILHFADLHLDASFAADGIPGDYGRQRRLALRSALTRILALARQRKVNAVTIAGDLYAQDYITPETTDFLLQQFQRLAPIRVIIAPGENDPYTNESPYSLLDWPENVDIFYQNKLTGIELAPGLSIWGAAHPPARDARILANFQAPKEGTHLLLLHTEMQKSTSSRQSVFNIEVGEIQKSGFAGALLGHQHMAQHIIESGIECFYPGSPEPLSEADTEGDHQLILVTVEDGAIKMEPISFQNWRYAALTIDLSDCSTNSEAARQVYQALAADGEDHWHHTSYRIALSGKLEFPLDLRQLQEEMNSPAYFTFELKLKPVHDLEELAQEQTVRGFLVQRLTQQVQQAKTPEEKRLAQAALNLALQALDGRQVNLYEAETY